MHRSSETLGAIASALAKAQGELSQPRKIAGRHHPLAISPRGRPDLSATPRSPAGWTSSASACGVSTAANRGSADSDDLAQVYRFDLAQDSEMISPTITILMSPGA
jgi:hypothetical protein